MHSESDRWSFELCSLALERPRFDEVECMRAGLTYTSPLKLQLTLTHWSDEDPRTIENLYEQEVYLSDLCLPSSIGTILVDGSHRAVRAELAPCVGLWPFERGWRFGNEWGDSIEFVRTEDRALLVRVVPAEDSIPSTLVTAPVERIGLVKGHVQLREPPMPETLRLRDADDVASFAAHVRMPTNTLAHDAVPRSVLDRNREGCWTPDVLRSVVLWLLSDEAARVANDAPHPVRVLAPAMLVARWVRRGIFLSAHHAAANGDRLTFGPLHRPRREPLSSWMPHDVWDARPLAKLLDARVRSEEHAPRCRLAFALETADLLRSVRIPPHIRAPAEWRSSHVGRETAQVMDLPLCELAPDGLILRPDRFSARSLARSLSESLPTLAPLPLDDPDPVPLDAPLGRALAESSGALRLTEQRVTVESEVSDAGAWTREATSGLLRFVEPWPLIDEDDASRREALSVLRQPMDAGSVLATTNSCRDGRLALGRIVRVGFDPRVSSASLWFSFARLGRDAFTCTRARTIERVLKRRAAGAERWEGANGADTLSPPGTRVVRGAALATVLIPKDRPADTAQGAVEARDPRRTPIRWTGPDALVVQRFVAQRRGSDPLPAVIEDSARVIGAREALVSSLDAPARDEAREQLAELRWRLERGHDLPPGVAGFARWTLAWSDPLQRGSTLSTLDGLSLTVERLDAEPLFDRDTSVDALVHPSHRAALACADDIATLYLLRIT